MASYALQTFVTQVDSRMLELKKSIEESEKKDLIKTAVETGYSRYKPFVRTSDVTGDGSFSVTINDSNLPDYVLDWSSLKIEYPYEATQAEPAFLEDDEWIIIPSGTTRVIRFLGGIEPSASETIRFHYTYPRKFTTPSGAQSEADVEVVIPDTDFYAVCDLAASYCLESVANKLTATGNSALSADTVNYRSKAGEARANAKVLRDRFETHLGIGKDAKARAFAAVGDFDTEYAIQVDWLTHPKRFY